MAAPSIRAQSPKALNLKSQALNSGPSSFEAVEPQTQKLYRPGTLGLKFSEEKGGGRIKTLKRGPDP